MSVRARRVLRGLKPRRAPGGLRLRGAKGPVGGTWWGRRWTAALESFGWHTRLERGRSYARRGQVVSVRVLPGKVKAAVRGSRSRPYEVTFAVRTLTPKDWSRVAGAVARKALHAAQLLAGEMPRGIEAAFPKARPLFPAVRKDIVAACSCPDAENPCKHIAAVHYILAQEFDRDPFLLFKLRGVSREGFLALLRARRPGARGASSARRPRPPRAEKGADLSGRLVDFYSAAKELPAGWGPSAARLAAAPAPGARVMDLGVPPFWSGELDFTDALRTCYEAARRRAERLADGR